MDVLGFLKKYFLQVAGVLVVAILVAVIWDTFFSGHAKMISLLEDQIEERDKRLETLRNEFEGLVEQEGALLAEIESLESQLGEVVSKIEAGSADIEAIKTSALEMEEALAIIKNNTRSVVTRSRGVLSGPDERSN